MSSTTFVDKVTVIATSWLQDINNFFYTLFNGATTAAQARTALGVSASPQEFIGNFTKDLTEASGSQAVTGVGFQPDSLEFWYEKTGTKEWGLGMVGSNLSLKQVSIFADSSSNMGAATGSGSGGVVINYIPTGGTAQQAYVSAYGADGFTLSWTKTGSPTGSLIVLYRARKWA